MRVASRNCVWGQCHMQCIISIANIVRNLCSVASVVWGVCVCVWLCECACGRVRANTLAPLCVCARVCLCARVRLSLSLSLSVSLSLFVCVCMLLCVCACVCVRVCVSVCVGGGGDRNWCREREREQATASTHRAGFHNTAPAEVRVCVCMCVGVARGCRCKTDLDGQIVREHCFDTGAMSQLVFGHMHITHCWSSVATYNAPDTHDVSESGARLTPHTFPMTVGLVLLRGLRCVIGMCGAVCACKAWRHGVGVCWLRARASVCTARTSHVLPDAAASNDRCARVHMPNHRTELALPAGGMASSAACAAVPWFVSERACLNKTTQPSTLAPLQVDRRAQCVAVFLHTRRPCRGCAKTHTHTYR